MRSLYTSHIFHQDRNNLRLSLSPQYISLLLLLVPYSFIISLNFLVLKYLAISTLN
jgi:hypothetical protein